MNVIAKSQNGSPHKLRELSENDLRGVKVESQKIDALTLIGKVTTASSPGAKKHVLRDCLIKCPRLCEHMSSCHFNRKALSPALTAEGAYYLILTLGDTPEALSKLESTCLVVGARVLGCQHAARELLKQVCTDFGMHPESGTEENERGDNFHEQILREQARQTALMNKLHASTQTILQAVQLQKSLGETVSSSLQAAAKDTIQQIEHSTANQGTHDAIDLLRMFDHSPTEATMMASSFGRFLRAASVPAHYTPNTRRVQFGVLQSACNDVALYNPRLHADIIVPAYDSFKQSPVYAKCVEAEAEHRRKLRRKQMEIADVAETHSKPRAALMINNC